MQTMPLNGWNPTPEFAPELSQLQLGALLLSTPLPGMQSHEHFMCTERATVMCSSQLAKTATWLNRAATSVLASASSSAVAGIFVSGVPDALLAVGSCIAVSACFLCRLSASCTYDVRSTLACNVIWVSKCQLYGINGSYKAGAQYNRLKLCQKHPHAPEPRPLQRRCTNRPARLVAIAVQLRRAALSAIPGPIAQSKAGAIHFASLQ